MTDLTAPADLLLMTVRDQLLAGAEVVLSDGATWRLSHFGHQREYRHWGFSRRRPGDNQWLAWVNWGLRQHQSAVAAVDELCREIDVQGPKWRRGDEWWDARVKGIERDKQRIIAALPEGHEVSEEYGCFKIGRRAPGGLSICVYTCDLANYLGHADQVLKRIASWCEPEPEELKPIESIAAKPEFLL